MPSVAKYFEERDANKPKPKWVYGDRVSGKFVVQEPIDDIKFQLVYIPVVGMVIREDYEDSSMVLCHLDLPVKYEGEYKWVMYVPSKGMKRLKVIEWTEWNDLHQMLT